MKRKFMKIWSLLRRVPLMVYISGTLVFEMAFIDENSFIQSYRYDRQISQLRKSVNHYQQIVDESKARLEELRSNDENLEKFARETYQMKRDNEDVFIIIDD
ncbi:MAG TPA: septum formation initiator family protein [Candidatus Caccoplasma intestinavium]|uniref:Septum formation initiator family protein n=1 Tax=Candidatus Caccoplasma intestinavium TaxID=2840716 RepID=A0A9D1KDQ4_9BACT|nr:septum formation initiator family protein [Coprobacter sp.]HIT40014.1 septum formation initiator family protein [Candidatus Caccoplasma intestinavium]